MPALTLERVCKSFGRTEVLRDIDLEVADGEFVVFVGPSGCGKSTLLRIIAGLEDASSGRVEIAGRDVGNLPPAKRGIAMVFQSYALYPHLTVRGNMALGLRQERRPKDEIARRIGEADRMLELGPFLDRLPAELSGGQRQRAAIGRAIVRQPELFLFDEPLSNLDAALRMNTRVEIASLHRKLKTAIVYVTHDQTEAMTLADRIVVLRDGRVEQIGTPMELYNDPVNRFVAGFLGAPSMNMIPAEALGGEAGEVIGIRPEDLSIAADGALSGRVAHVERLGGDTHVLVDAGLETLVTMRLFGQSDIAAETAVNLSHDPGRAFRFDAEGRRLRSSSGA